MANEELTLQDKDIFRDGNVTLKSDKLQSTPDRDKSNEEMKPVDDTGR